MTHVLIAAAWPYANGPRHLGHVVGFALPADVSARYWRLRGAEVLFVSGTDEHGTPISVLAEEEGVSPREIADRYNAVIRDDLVRLGISYSLFTRTTTAHHARVVNRLLEAATEAGYVHERESVGAFAGDRSLPDRYLRGGCPRCGETARGDQCDECGTPLSPTELVNPRSIIDGRPPEFRPTRHLAFDLPALERWLREWVAARAPDWRPHAVAQTGAMLDDLRVRDITRDIDWGVEIDRDGYRAEDGKRLYVWFDAVAGYLSASQEATDDWREWWCSADARHEYMHGVDNLPFHSILWPAMLKAGESAYGPLHLPDRVVASRFLKLGEQQFSSSNGVVVHVGDAIDRFGVDAIRYALLAGGPERADAEFRPELLVARNDDELLAKWGNLVQRSATLGQRHWGGIPDSELGEEELAWLERIEPVYEEVGAAIEDNRYREALSIAFGYVDEVNRLLAERAPWTEVKHDVDGAGRTIRAVLTAVVNLNVVLSPSLPHLSNAVSATLGGEPVAPLPMNDLDAERISSPRGTERWAWRSIEPRSFPRPRPLVAKLRP